MKPDYKQIPVLVTRGSFIFPGYEKVLEIGRQESIEALKRSISEWNFEVVLVSQIDPKENHLNVDSIYKHGVLTKFSVKKIWEDESYTVSFKALSRVALTNVTQAHPRGTFKADMTITKPFTKDLEKLKATVIKRTNEFARGKPSISSTLLKRVNHIEEMDSFLDTLARSVQIRSLEQLQALVRSADLDYRFTIISNYLMSKKSNLEIDDKINRKIKNKVDEQQKEFYLRERLKAIKEELGEMDSSGSSKKGIKEYRKRLETEPFPQLIKERILAEINHYESLPQASSEANVIRSYIDWMMVLPWWEISEEINSLKFAKSILDTNHYGLKKVKERIIEYLALKIRAKSTKGQIICLVGPPGVGKSSLARSIADAIGRKFVKISLGGIKDESEIKGHRKTYIGAMPGRIIQSMKRAKTINPLILLDEIDKMSSDYRGDPASAMLEVLDPDQNNSFSDHYIEEDYDLSKVMFIATANYYQNIPEALVDRMDCIFLSSYTEIEKLQIAKRHLVPKVLLEANITNKEVKFSVSGLKEIIKHYTREAGVRELERKLRAIVRKFLVKLLNKEVSTLNVNAVVVKKYLGTHQFEHTSKERSSQIGVATGLAYTQYGGDILPIEVNYFPGKGKLILTGKLGEIMRESASIALSYIKSNSKLFKINQNLFEDNDIHVHVPEGAVPKDGPSAGITLTTAIISALTQTPIPNNLGMTGEITLRGHILPIGGLKEKSVAARRSGLKQIFIPKKNEKDLQDLPDEVKKALEIKFYADYKQLYKELFNAKPVLINAKPKAKPKPKIHPKTLHNKPKIRSSVAPQ